MNDLVNYLAVEFLSNFVLFNIFVHLEKYTDDDSEVSRITLKEELVNKNGLINELEKKIKLLEEQLDNYKEDV